MDEKTPTRVGGLGEYPRPVIVLVEIGFIAGVTLGLAIGLTLGFVLK